MSDKKRDHDKKVKQAEMEEMDHQYMEMPMQPMYNLSPGNQMCPMMYQCPMMHQCPMMGGQMNQQTPMPMMGGQMMHQPMWPQPMMQMQQMADQSMRVKDWYDDWDEFSEDSSFEFDSDDYKHPEKYYKKYYKKHGYPYFWPPFFPNFRK
jgi:hypothetical protein